jgi:hypothetical protein
MDRQTLSQDFQTSFLSGIAGPYREKFLQLSWLSAARHLYRLMRMARNQMNAGMDQILQFSTLLAHLPVPTH